MSRSPANFVAGEDVDALGVDGGEQIIEIVGRGDVTGQEVVDLAVGEIALFLAGVDELVYVVFVLVDFFSHGCAHSCEKFYNWDAADGSVVFRRRYPWVVA